ncbi:MAG: efflux RND transporter periplasmic adaptor subunit [Deltaproteobacteria bacterium]|nr:efflux RND transporter periplasmic adaptor subunit [Deltaproteobacteria bacterium]
MKKILIIISILAGLGVFNGCNPQEKEKVVKSKPRSVSITEVESRNLPIVVNSVGRLAPNHEVVLSSQVSGIVQAYRVDTGDAVTANKMLVLLDPTDYQLALNEARANLHSARARYAAAKNSFLRAGELLPEKVITTEAYEKIEAEYKTSQAAVSQAEAAVDINQRRLDKTAIKAPFDGFVINRMVEKGQNINVGEPVMAIADMQSMRVKIHVNEQDYVYLDKDDAVTVLVEAYPNASFFGTIDRIGVKADPNTNTFEVEILVANSNLLFKAGLTATVNITIDEIKDAIMIPQSSVLFRQNRQEVFVVAGGDKAVVREVKLGRADGSLVRIVKGLIPGDKLVTTGSQYLKDGDSVEVTGSR